MPNPKINWINDHTQICDRLDTRVQLMQDYLASKPDDFDGIATKRFLLGQAREQVTWYRQSIDALDFVRTLSARLQLPRNRPRHRIQTRPRLPDLARNVVVTGSRRR